MNIASHLEKLDRFDSIRRRLEPSTDFELWFWATMNGGTHAINAALHAAGVTDSGDYFPMQPGVYLVADDEGQYKPTFRPLGDVLHVGRPAIDRPVPPQLRQMMAAMEIIEGNRDPCVRGGREPTPEIIAMCDGAYNECLDLARKILKLR